MTSIKGKRTVEVHPVQRGYFPRNFHHNDTITDISNAWENINEAKRVLNRAETRANEAAMPLSAMNRQRSSNHRSPSYHWGITPTKDPVARVPRQEPSSHVNHIDGTEYRRVRKPKQRSRYRHQGNSHFTEPYFGEKQHGLSRHSNALPSPRTGVDSGLDILERGPTELTLNDRTEVRVLNDVPMESERGAYDNGDYTVEVSPGLKVNSDYIPAYDQLYGEGATGANRTRQTKNKLGDRRPLTQGKSLTLAQIEVLRRRVESQKHQSTSYGRMLDTPMPQKSQHRESDPVLYRHDSEFSEVTGEYEQYDRTPVRKIARAPPAPHYRGFNLPETHYKLQDGRIVDEETMNRKQSRKGKHQRGETPRQLTAGIDEIGTLQPSKTGRDSNQERPSRKVHRKKASTSRREKSNEEKSIAASKVGAHAWREGQKVVREALGPLRAGGKEKVPHSPPTKDGRTLDLPSRLTLQEDGLNLRRDRPEARVDSPTPDEQRDIDENVANVQRSKLSSEAKDVLKDLNLDSEGESEHGDEEECEGDRANPRRPLSFIIEPRKPPLGRSKANSDNQQADVGEPVMKVRHYDSREVRQYMVQQKNRRRKKQQEEEQERKEAEARKRKQLEELYRKQKDSTSKPSRGVVQPASAAKEGREKRPLDETYNKEPPSVVVKPRRPAGEGRRYPPRTQAMRKLDVTSSDKENKAFWTTSSSDTSSRSSPQTDMTSQTVQASHPANQPPTGGDIILVPVTEEDAPISVVGRQKVSSSDAEASRAGTSTPASRSEGRPEENEEPPKPPVGTAKPPTKPAELPVVGRAKTSNDERLQALKETASALHSRLDSEVKKLALSLRALPQPVSTTPRRESLQSPLSRLSQPILPRHSPLHDLLSQQMSPVHPRMDHPLSPRHLTWHNRLGSPSEDRWAFSVSSSRHPGDVNGRRQGSPFQTRHQRTLAMEEPNQVFRGSLPGVGSMSHHAAEAYRTRRQEMAATKIQAAFRGHSVRQKMGWATQPRAPWWEEARADHLTLSEGTLSDDVSVTAEEDYLPKFQSLGASPHQHLAEPTPSTFKPSSVADVPQSISSMLRTPSAFEPTNDGLSVIDIFTRRYQQAQRSLLAPRSAQNEPSPPKTTPPKHQPSDAALPQEQSISGRLTRPTTLEYSDDDFNSLSHRTQSSLYSQKAHEHPRDALSPQDRTDTSSFEVPDSDRVVTGSEFTADARKSPTSSHSSTGTTASISAALGGDGSVPDSGTSSPPSAATPRRPRWEVINSPCSLPLSPTQDNHKPTSRSPQSDPGHRVVRRSPLGSNAYSSSDDEAPRTVRSRKRRGRKSPSSRKSPALSPEAPRNFRPITSPGVPPPTSNPSPVSRPPPPSMPSMVGYSPGALQLKMASELNLLEMLDASSQQLAEMEHARTIALAHEESAALARVLQGRQADYERQLQLLNLKSRQEVEDARRQLQDVQQGYAETTLAAQRDLVKSQQKVVDARRGAADRLLQTQAEASRITAEAARQLAEAQRAALAQPPPPPPIDVSKLTADSVHAGVSAALEQQRLQQQELLKDMKNGYKSPPPLRRSLGIGVSLPERVSLSPLTPDRSPTPHYTEDFTRSSSASQSPSKVSSQARDKTTSSITESLEHTNGSRTVPTQVSRETHRDTRPENPPTGGKEDKTPGPVSSMYSLRSVESENDSSIHTDSDAKRATVNDTASISERLDETKSVSDDNSLSFEHSLSEVESVVDTSERAPPPGGKTHSEIGKGPSEEGSERTMTMPVQDTSSPASPIQDLSRGTPSPPRLTADFIRQQLEEEKMRAQHQAALLNLREKALEDKTQAELQWLEYQKRQSKNSGDEDGLNLLRRKQRQLYARMTSEKEEIRLLREAQASAGRKLQRLIEEQETIAKLQQSAQQSKAKTQAVTTPLTPHLTSFESLVSEDSLQRSKVTSPSSPSQGPRDRMSPLFGAAATVPPDLSPAEKQAKALQSAKLSARVLSKRAVSLRKRRKEAEELLAWKQKLDQEEEEVKKLEERVKSRLKTAKPPSRSSPQLTTPTQESAAPTPPEPHSESNSEVSERLESVSSGGGTSKSRTKASTSSGGRPKSRSGDKSVPEELSMAPSSINEEIEAGSSQSKSRTSQSKSKKSPGLNSSGEETVKDVSQAQDYSSESFDSSVDQTLTQVHTPSPSRNSPSLKSSPIWLSPRHRRGRPEPESGSESERSLSQTFSETASDQSDIEGRIRALSDSLKKRKIEADKLRKQQKRLCREKLKAQEASLKKQLETYDSFIDQTRNDLVKEKEAHTPPLLPGAKPQIKQLSISETQRKRDQSHTRALRQRTASESSVEGSGMDIAKKRSLGRHTSRSTSIEEEPVSSLRDVKEGHEGEKRKSADPTSRSRSLSGDSSITEDISLRSLEDQSISDVSVSVSTKSKEKPETEGIKEEDMAPERDQSRQAEESTATVTPDHESRRSREDLLADGIEATDQRGPGSRAGSSDIPEEIGSVLSDASSLSRPIQRLDLLKEEEGGSDAERKARSRDVSVKSARDAKSSLAEEELPPQQSPRTESRTGSPKTVPSKRSPRKEQSYSEDFQESSMTIDIRESKSDTEDDISEHLSDRSTASGESQVSEKFVARPSQEEPEEVQEASVVVSNDALDVSDRSHLGEAEKLPSPEVTVSPKRPEDIDGSNAVPETKPSVVVPVTDSLPGLPVGSRVDADGYGSGVLRFKGQLEGRDGVWLGIKLDQPNGSSDGTHDGISYFQCPNNHGVFVTPDRVRDEVVKMQSTSFVDDKVQDKSGSSIKFPEDLHTGEYTDDAESIVEEISEGVTDDAALQKVIISTAEAVESFSLDRDEPEGIESPQDTPRGAPPEEEEIKLEEHVIPSPELIERLANSLIEEVVKESLETVIDAMEKQRLLEEESKGDKADKSKSLSFLGLITPPEGEVDHEPSASSVPEEQEIPSRGQLVGTEVNGVLKSLVAQTVDEMIKLRESRDKKWNTEFSPATPDKPVRLADLDKLTTSHTSDSAGATLGDELDAPLPEELFVNKVQVESAISGIRDIDDATPRARPTSPIFGESGSISPQALCDKLEQLQALDQDIFGADIFGGQEWFDDDFGSMPKTNSIIQVPPRVVNEGMGSGRSPSPEEPLPKYNEARKVELKRFMEEPFMAVPHNAEAVGSIMEKAVKMVHHRAVVGEPLSPLSPTHAILGADTIGSDIESTSKKAYKRLVFDLAKETYRSVKEEQETVSSPPWMKPKRRPRKYLFREAPKTLREMHSAVNTQALKVIGLGPRQMGEAYSKYALKKKRDKVDEILIQELREEEQEWVDYDDDELSVKMQLTDAIFASLLSDTISVISRIEENRLHRTRTLSQSDSDIEF